MKDDEISLKVDLPGQSDIFGVLCTSSEVHSENTEVPQGPDEEQFFTNSNAQLSFVDSDEWWKEHWVGMPEFIQNDTTPWKSLYVHFRCIEDLREFAELIQQRITRDTPSVWHPVMPREKRMCMGYIYES